MTTQSFFTHQEIFDKAARQIFAQGDAGKSPRERGNFPAYCGGCPIGNLIDPLDYLPSMQGVAVLFLGVAADLAPPHMHAGLTALRRALLRSRINVYNPSTIELLVCLQHVRRAKDRWEWRDRLGPIADQFGLCADLLEQAA
ncbi:hypothetical protein ABH944_001193 [Caballeronia udeis]|uniref:Uncharacterized protein n=1 Tax=Caballeronia udeis TaxID=1232866 RepID=A0ABW8MF41_9BURK